VFNRRIKYKYVFGAYELNHEGANTHPDEYVYFILW